MRSEKRRNLLQGNDLKRVGIFGGTLDPVHCGHLICAEQLRESIGLGKVLFMPCSTPPHKAEYTPASSEHRMRMVSLAVEDDEFFVPSDLEISKGGVSYTIDTVRRLRRSCGESVEIWLLMGMDAFLDIPNWREPEELGKECFFGVARRPGFGRRRVRGVPARRTQFVDITAVDISSTDIRERLLQGRSIRFLVPSAVERYIAENTPYLGVTRP